MTRQPHDETRETELATPPLLPQPKDNSSCKTHCNGPGVVSFIMSAAHSRLHHAGHQIQMERGAQLCGCFQRGVAAAVQGAGPSSTSYGDLPYHRYLGSRGYLTVGIKQRYETPLRGTLDRNSHDSYHVLLLYFCTKHYEWCEIVFFLLCHVKFVLKRYNIISKL